MTIRHALTVNSGKGANDFIVHGDTVDDALIVDGSADTATFNVPLTVDNGIVSIYDDLADNSNATSQQLWIGGVSDNTKGIGIGYDTTNDHGFIQVADKSTAYKALSISALSYEFKLSTTTAVTFTTTELVFNASKAAIDFIVHTDTVDDAFKIDGTNDTATFNVPLMVNDATTITQSVPVSTTTEYLSLLDSAGGDPSVLRIAGKVWNNSVRTAIDFIQNSSSNFRSEMSLLTNTGGALREGLRIDYTQNVSIPNGDLNVNFSATFNVSKGAYNFIVHGDSTDDMIRVTASGNLLGFYGVSPAAQAAHIADPTGGATVDAEARTAINSILVVLENLGLKLAA